MIMENRKLKFLYILYFRYSFLFMYFGLKDKDSYKDIQLLNIIKETFFAVIKYSLVKPFACRSTCM